MEYKIKQVRAVSMWDPGHTIEKSVTEKELIAWGFFPLTEYEQKFYDEHGFIRIEGDGKYTEITPLMS